MVVYEVKLFPCVKCGRSDATYGPRGTCKSCLSICAHCHYRIPAGKEVTASNGLAFHDGCHLLASEIVR